MSTISTVSEVRTPTQMPTEPRSHLFVVMNCAAPFEAPSRHALDGIDEVHVGRAAARTTVCQWERGQRRLALTLTDARVSSAHARLVRRDCTWTLEDLGSKNGTCVNGASVREAVLADGDCIQVGQILLLFRAALPTPDRSPADLQATARAAAFATLLPRLAREFDVLAMAATSDMPVLLVSETGTGKEVLARAVHVLSRRSGDFVPVNCGGQPPTLVESLLFGHKRGAFSGALGDEPGLLRTASGGTLLLDEIGDMPLAVQTAVLRALQDGEVLPVGATRPVRVDLRVIAATHRDLEARVSEGLFREDLLARLSGFTFRLPPLRERREDIGLLIGALLRRFAEKNGDAPTLSAEAALRLLLHAWPRNVRELEKCIAHAMALATEGRIELEHLPDAVRRGTFGRPPPSSHDQLRVRLTELLAESRGNVSTVAAEMHTSRSQVHRWMKRFALQAQAFRR
jgi:DNA-binding NtrC family response regulator